MTEQPSRRQLVLGTLASLLGLAVPRPARATPAAVAPPRRAYWPPSYHGPSAGYDAVARLTPYGNDPARALPGWPYGPSLFTYPTHLRKPTAAVGQHWAADVPPAGRAGCPVSNPGAR